MSPKVIHCTTCNEPLYAGIAHVCPALRQPVAAVHDITTDDGEIKSFLWKLFSALTVMAITQLIAAIWWASAMQADVRGLQQAIQEQKSSFQKQLDGQQAIIERLDSYFRRPPPQ